MPTIFINIGFNASPFQSWNFPSSSIYTNIDYLFWRLPSEYEYNYFTWIMWYILKNRNDKVYKNRNGNPMEILRIAKVEGAWWLKHNSENPKNQEKIFHTSGRQELGDTGWCYVEGAWREQDFFTGKGWFYIRWSYDRSHEYQTKLISPLHAECEALI